MRQHPRYLGTTPQLKNVRIKFDCEAGDCTATIRSKQNDSAAFQFNLNDVSQPLELEWVECPKTKQCFGEILSLIIHSARSLGWQGTTITLDADDKGSGKLVKYYESFGFHVDAKEFERAYGNQRSVADVLQSKQFLKTIPMRLNVSHMPQLPPSTTRRARIKTRKQSSSARRSSPQQSPRRSMRHK